MKEKLLKLQDNKVLDYLMPIIVLVLMCILFTITTGGRFSRATNLKMIFNQSLLVGIIATGGVMIYSSGNMNIAMGGSTAIACIVGAWTYLATSSPFLMFLACIGVGLLIMTICCVLSQVLKISIMLITMILLTLLTGLQEWMVGGLTIQLPYPEMSKLAQAGVPIIIAVVFFLICLFIFDFTKFGKTAKFIGDNITCAKLTGINETRIVVIGFLISGIAIGLGAGAFLIRSATVNSSSCSSLNMDVVLAIVIAGTQMGGGSKSKVYSGLVGAITTTVLSNGLLMLHVTSIYIQAVKGILFILILILGNKRPDVLPVKDMMG